MTGWRRKKRCRLPLSLARELEGKKGAKGRLWGLHTSLDPIPENDSPTPHIPFWTSPAGAIMGDRKEAEPRLVLGLSLLPGMRQIAPSNSGGVQTHLPNFFSKNFWRCPVTIATTSFLRSPWQLARTDAQFFSCPEAPPFSHLHPKTRTAGAAGSEEELMHGGGACGYHSGFWDSHRLRGREQERLSSQDQHLWGSLVGAHITSTFHSFQKTSLRDFHKCQHEQLQ